MNDTAVQENVTIEQQEQRPSERDLYMRAWSDPRYREHAPGEAIAHMFLQQAKPKVGARVIDVGCGSGRGGLLLALLGGMEVTLMDFASNCLDEEIQQALTTQAHALHWVEHDITKPFPVTAPYAYCTDVLEHIPPADVDKVLDNVLQSAQHCFFNIATFEDAFGAVLGHPLHLSVHPYEWWLEKFQDRKCVVHFSADLPQGCIFYVTAWVTGQEVVDVGVLNTTKDTVRKNVEHNIAQGWMQVQPYETNDVDVMILGGGPSLNEFEGEIKQLRADGVKLITLNGSYNWAIEHGLTPSAQIVVDARAFNARFTRPAVPDCKYFIASQCDPSVLEGLPEDRTFLWHTTAEMIKDLLQAQYTEGRWYPIPGGSTVLLRAIPLMRMLGFKRFHLFGCDSCLSDRWQLLQADGKWVMGPDGQTVGYDKLEDAKAACASEGAPAGLKPTLAHHSYGQPENDEGFAMGVCVNGGRIFRAHPWMISQAQEFVDMIRMLGDEIELEPHGDGLLTYILQTGADLTDLQPNQLT